MEWRIYHRAETQSTNLDARAGAPGDVFTADYQTAGRGRLDHKWLSAPGENLMMSAVLSVADLPPEQVATLPLVVGLAVIDALEKDVLGVSCLVPCAGETTRRTKHQAPSTKHCGETAKHQELTLKWPNDILFAGRKLAGILCERQGDVVIVGLGVNVNQRTFPPEIADRATSFSLILAPQAPDTQHQTLSTKHQTPSTKHCGEAAKHQALNTLSLRDSILASLAAFYSHWKTRGLSPFLERLAAVDCLRGQTLRVLQTDDDTEPLIGICDGIAPDGSLLVAGRSVYAGEAHILRNEDMP